MATTTYPAPNALAIYAKPLPLNVADWASDAVAFAAVGSLDVHQGDVDATKDYFIFIRVGASPASTDAIDGAISGSAAASSPETIAAAVLAAATAAPIHANVRKINGNDATPATDVAKESSVQEIINNSIRKLEVS